MLRERQGHDFGVSDRGSSADHHIDPRGDQQTALGVEHGSGEGSTCALRYISASQIHNPTHPFLVISERPSLHVGAEMLEPSR
jgi:hypothetical protein